MSVGALLLLEAVATLLWRRAHGGFLSSESALEQFGRGKNLSGSSRDVSDWRDFLFGTAYLLTLDGPQVDPCRQRDTHKEKGRTPKVSLGKWKKHIYSLML